MPLSEPPQAHKVIAAIAAGIKCDFMMTSIDGDEGAHAAPRAAACTWIPPVRGRATT
jgi:hypothetical protein